MTSTDPAYAARLARISGRRWKRFVPNPYRWNVRRLARGRVLDVGCGIGRCLRFFPDRAVGVDPNVAAVQQCRDAGLVAYTPVEFAEAGLARPASFDTVLCAHVVEHLTAADAVGALQPYVALLVADGRVVVIVPQERGQASDPTHVRLLGEPELRELAAALGLTVESVRSFPLPRRCGRWWIYNETVMVARVSGDVPAGG